MIKEDKKIEVFNTDSDPEMMSSIDDIIKLKSKEKLFELGKLEETKAIFKTEDCSFFIKNKICYTADR